MNLQPLITAPLNSRWRHLLWLAVLFGALHSVVLAAGQISNVPYDSTLDLRIPPESSNQLPELGDASQMVMSARDEERIASQILKQVVVSDEVFEDAEVNDYLQALGERLAASGPDKSQKFRFFMVQNKAINAFAMPGGVIGVHTGLFLAANSESELASVLGHEIGHVTQHHLARMMAQQKYDIFKNIAVTALALLVMRSNPQAGAGAMTASAAAGVQRQLDYTREHEREADRVGLSILDDAGFDVRGMPAFFTTMQRATRFSDGNLPSYLRTHPLTSERIADIGDRVQNRPYKPVNENPAFFLMRAKIRAFQGLPVQAVEEFQHNIADTRYRSEQAEHYGLAYAYLRAGQPAKALQEWQWLNQHGVVNAYTATLRALIDARQNSGNANSNPFAAGLRQYPQHRALALSAAEWLIQNRQWNAAITYVQQQLPLFPNDAKLYDWLAAAYQGLNKQMLRHQALGESYVRRYDLAHAVDQFELASKAKDGDFYLQSKVEARLTMLRAQLAQEKSEQEKDK